MKRPIVTRMLLALSFTLLVGGCEAGPSEPIAEDLQVQAPAAAVLAPAEALPFWERGPICCLDDYAVIYFYVADPSVVPADFNLLGLFDFRALGAELAVGGFGIFADASDFAPRKSKLHGTSPVTFWFVPRALLDEVAADGFVSVTDLVDRDEMIVGLASQFREELHPSGSPAPQVQLNTSARGTLVDGGRFRFTYATHINPDTGKRTMLVDGSLDFD